MLDREHIERTHLDVQCGRCAQTFDGTPDKRVTDLHTHTLEICSDNRPFTNEGVSRPQWGLIKEKTNGKKSSGNGPPTPEVQKWNDIWEILFLGHECPNPCKLQHYLLSLLRTLTSSRVSLLTRSQLLTLGRRITSRTISDMLPFYPHIPSCCSWTIPNLQRRHRNRSIQIMAR